MGKVMTDDRLEEIEELLTDNWFVDNPNGSDVNEYIKWLIAEVRRLRAELRKAPIETEENDWRPCP